MTSPVVHAFPVKRPGFVNAIQWQGGDQDLALLCSYTDLGDVTRSIVFPCRGPNEAGELCLPASSDLANLSGTRQRDILVAHARMACMVAGLAVPGSKEFTDAFVQSETNNLQTALGTVKVTAVDALDDQCVTLTFKQGTGPAYPLDVDHDELNKYAFVPSTQLLVIPGSIKKQFPTYVHDGASNILTQAQRDNIEAYVLALAPWI